MSIFNRRRSTSSSRAGRPIPPDVQSKPSGIESSKGSRDKLYQMEFPDPGSPIVATTFPHFPLYRPHQSASSTPSCRTSMPLRSPTAPPQGNNAAGGITFPTSGSILKSAPILRAVRRTSNPTPIRFPSPAPKSPLPTNTPEESAPACSSLPVPPPPTRSRSRTSSASSWIKRVVSRSSSRSSLRKHYDQIPLSEEEKKELERIREIKAQEAIKEWNRINEAVAKAGL